MILLLWAGPAVAQPCFVRAIGTRHLDVEPCLEDREPPVGTGLGAYAEPVRDALVARYHAAGYLAARASIRVEDGAAVVQVDEGRIHRIRLLGANSLERLTLADNLEFAAGSILHEPTLQDSLDRIARIEELRSVTWSLAVGDDVLQNAFGVMEPERILDVHLVSEEERGWGVGIEVVPRWGLVTGLTWDGSRPRHDDHLSTAVQIATPYQEWATEQQPRLRWTYGALLGTYRTPSFPGVSTAPVLAARTSLAQYHRLDIGLRSAMVQDGRVGAAVLFGRRSDVRAEVGLAAEAAAVYSADQRAGADPVRTAPVLRLLATALGTWAPDDGTLRTDLQDRLELEAEVGGSTSLKPLVRLAARALAVGKVGRSDAILRVHGAWRDGQLRFFDEIPVAGPFQRVFFDDRFWVSRLLQVEVAYRMWVRRNVKLGVYHDLSAFPDREDGAFRILDAVGPGVHLLLLDNFAFDLYYGFGWAPRRFSHNLSLTLQTVY